MLTKRSSASRADVFPWFALLNNTWERFLYHDCNRVHSRTRMQDCIRTWQNLDLLLLGTSEMLQMHFHYERKSSKKIVLRLRKTSNSGLVIPLRCFVTLLVAIVDNRVQFGPDTIQLFLHINHIPPHLDRVGVLFINYTVHAGRN